MDRQIIESYQINHYIKFKDVDDSRWIKVTEINTAEFERENNEYTPEWIDYKVQPTYATGSKDTLNLELSLMGPGGIQAEFFQREDDYNVAVEYVRTVGFDFKEGKPCEETALVAKHATGVLNVTPITQEASSAAVIAGTLSINSTYDYGTFDATACTYTPGGGEPPAGGGTEEGVEDDATTEQA